MYSAGNIGGRIVAGAFAVNDNMNSLILTKESSLAADVPGPQLRLDHDVVKTHRSRSGLVRGYPDQGDRKFRD